MENNAYLENGFDPNKLRVPELRNILNRHNVDYNSGTKKSELVDLFNTNIVPEAPALLEKAKAVKPDSRGILIHSPAVSTPRRGRPAKQAAPVSDNEGSPSRKALEQSDVDSPSEGEKGKKGKPNFSDENPFQNSPTPSKKKPKSARSTKLATSDRGLKAPAISNPATTTEFSTISKRYKGGYLSMMDTPPHFSQTQRPGTNATPQFAKFMAPPPHTPIPFKISDDPSTPAPASPVRTTPLQMAASPLAVTPQSQVRTPTSMKPPSTPATRRRRLRSDVSDDENAKTATDDEEHPMKTAHRNPRAPIDNRRSSSSTFWLLLFCLFWFITWYRSKMVEKG